MTNPFTGHSTGRLGGIQGDFGDCERDSSCAGDGGAGGDADRVLRGARREWERIPAEGVREGIRERAEFSNERRERDSRTSGIVRYERKPGRAISVSRIH
ncbi:MAG: hypothetical protein AMXMBFR47_06720 [Planctomycetota bacterium]